MKKKTIWLGVEASPGGELRPFLCLEQQPTKGPGEQKKQRGCNPPRNMLHNSGNEKQTQEAKFEGEQYRNAKKIIRFIGIFIASAQSFV